jgi:hypothetical protein
LSKKLWKGRRREIPERAETGLGRALHTFLCRTAKRLPLKRMSSPTGARTRLREADVALDFHKRA